MCLRVYLFGFTSECVAACRLSALGCVLLFYMCEYCKKKRCVPSFPFLCVFVYVSTPHPQLSVQCRKRLMHSMFLSRVRLCVFVCACVCACV